MPVCSGPMSPRVALLTPFAFPSVRGNAVTAARVAHGLRARGVEVDVWDLSLHPGVAVEAEVDAFRPAVVHAFHAYRAGPLALPGPTGRDPAGRDADRHRCQPRPLRSRACLCRTPCARGRRASDRLP